MFFLLLFNFTLLRGCKDALLVSEISHLAIPYVKVFGSSLAAIVFLLLYTHLANRFTRSTLFYISILPFVLFFIAFALVLYPNKEWLALSALGTFMENQLPNHLQYVAAIVRMWPFALFYIMAELWSTVSIGLLFWGFANDITKVGEAKRIYPLLPLLGNFGPLLVGPTIQLCTWLGTNIPLHYRETTGAVMFYLMLIFTVSASMVALVHWIIRKKTPAEKDPSERKRNKTGVFESFRFIAGSRYLSLIGVIVFSYGVAVNLIEVAWKGQLKMQYPSTGEYLRFMGTFSTVTGIVTIGFMLLLGSNMIRRVGWTAAALFTPVVILITGGAFFATVLWEGSLSGVVSAFGMTPLFLAVLIGSAQNILTKSSKYSIFDPTKEMAYIPLDPQTRIKGKAAIDVVGARMGKSTGSAIQIGLPFIPFFAANITSCFASIVLLVTIGWILSTRSLGRRFSEMTGDQVDNLTPTPQNV